MEEKKCYRFIVIDDDPVNNHICKEYVKLVFPGADIKTFTEPKEGLEYILSTYDKTYNALKTILFLDINMPILTGWDVLERFMHFSEEVKKYFKIYILSSSIAPDDKSKANTNPLVVGFVEKPLSVEQLEELTKIYLQ